MIKPTQPKSQARRQTRRAIIQTPITQCMSKIAQRNEKRNQQTRSRRVNKTRHSTRRKLLGMKVDSVEFVCVLSLVIISWLTGIATLAAYQDSKIAQREKMIKQIIAERPSIEIRP